MRNRISIGLVLILSSSVLAQGQRQPEIPSRYGINARLRDYPQASAKETLASVISTMESRRLDYLLAHLADPAFVDERVKQVYGGQFDELVRETSQKLADNPGVVKELQHFLKDGEWEGSDTTASAKVKDIPDRQVFLKKIGNRWFLENRQKPEEMK